MQIKNRLDVAQRLRELADAVEDGRAIRCGSNEYSGHDFDTQPMIFYCLMNYEVVEDKNEQSNRGLRDNCDDCGQEFYIIDGFVGDTIDRQECSPLNNLVALCRHCADKRGLMNEV